MMMPTAMSITLPFIANSLNSLNISHLHLGSGLESQRNARLTPAPSSTKERDSESREKRRRQFPPLALMLSGGLLFGASLRDPVVCEAERITIGAGGIAHRR
jgi:hypothetical protein